MAIWLVALALPIVFFTVLTGNLHERAPVLPFLLCPVLCAGAGWLTVKNLSWVGWGAVIGVIEAALLVFTV